MADFKWPWEEEKRDWKVPAAVGAGTAALSLPFLMRARKSSNPALQALREAVGDKPVAIATGSPVGSKLRSLLFGAEDVSEMMDTAARAGQRLDLPDKAVLHHGFDLPVTAGVAINAGSLPDALQDKGHFATVMKQVAPDAIPETHNLKDALRQFGSYEALQQHFADRGFFIKPRVGSLSSVADFVNETTPMEAQILRDALQYPDQFVIQEKIPLVNEYRVHSLNTEPLTATYRRAPLPDPIVEAWEDLTESQGVGRGGFAHVPVMGDKRQALMDFVREAERNLYEKGPVGRSEHLHHALDVAELPDGTFKLIESNPVPGTMMNPLVSRTVTEAITGRRSPGSAATLAAGTGLGTAGLTALLQEVYERDPTWGRELNKQGSAEPGAIRMTPHEQGYVAAMKTAGLWDTAKDLARLVGTGRSTLRHGTSSAAAKQIRAQGLIPQGSSGISELVDLADHEKGLAFLTRGQGQARNYALQAEGIRDTQRALNAEDTVESLLGGGAVSSLYRRGVPEATRAQADKNVRRFLQDPQGRVTASRLYGMAPGFGGKGEVVRAEVPWHKLQKMEGTQVEPYRDNSAFMMLDAADDMFQEAYGKRLHLRATPFMDVVAVPGGVPASAIRGGDAFQRPTLHEVREHFQNVARDPRGFAKEIARTVTGLQHRPSTIMAKAPNAGQT